MAETLDAPGTEYRPALLATPRARVGVIIPSSNRLAEPQLRHYLPDDVALHVTRLRMTGPWHKPLDELGDAIREAAGALADSKCDVIVFNCTGGAMRDGAEAEARMVETIARETGAAALSTGEAVVTALRALSMSAPVLVSPYVQATNDAEKAYLEGLGFRVPRDVALGLSGGDEYITVPPERWLELAREAVCDEADGIFLSCTNTTQIEAVTEVERETGLPCVNSNQAVLWRTLAAIAPRLGAPGAVAGPGRLFRQRG